MKKVSVIIFLLFFVQTSYAQIIGKIIHKNGKVQKISISTGEYSDLSVGSQIRKGEKIKTGEKSVTQVLLKDGTTIKIYEKSHIFFIDYKKETKDSPTKINLEYGKVRIMSKFRFNKLSMVVTTPTSVISLVLADFGIIAAELETKVLVYSSKVGIANINPDLQTAYVLYKGEEITVKKNRVLDEPKKISESTMRWWFENYKVIDKNRRIIHFEKDHDFIDWLLRKREF